MRKYIRLSLLFLVCLGILSGCGCNHQWVEATCTAPKTCTLCGKTEGQPLSHSWAEATCAVPRTCTLCGETEGEPLPHTWGEANYQDAKTCAVCGETEGSPLTASFKEHGLVINLAENFHTIDSSSHSSREPYDYVTNCSNNPSVETIGKLYICDYRIFQSDDTHKAVDGYAWRAFDLKVDFSDENAQRYGYNMYICRENYYSIEDWDNKEVDISETPWAYLAEAVDESVVSIVNYHGTDYPCLFTMENSQAGSWQTTVHIDESGNTTKVTTSQWTATFYVCVPVGYDGMVVGFYDGRNAWEEGMHIYDVADSNTLFFRLDNTEYQW